MADATEDLDAPDSLLSVNEIARRWATDRTTVADLVASGEIESLDGGKLVRAGRLDIPCVRWSWAESIRVDTPGAERRIDDQSNGKIHPAAHVAYGLHVAMQQGDKEAVWQLSSDASRASAGSPSALMEMWGAVLAGAIGEGISLTTGVYRLTPHPGVGVRLVGVAPPLMHVVTKATPVPMAGLIALVAEHDGWFADVEISGRDVNWAELLRSAPPPA